MSYLFPLPCFQAGKEKGVKKRAGAEPTGSNMYLYYLYRPYIPHAENLKRDEWIRIGGWEGMEEGKEIIVETRAIALGS